MTLNLVVALPCEARPLIDGLRLQRCPSSGIYSDRRHTYALAVSGIGTIAAAIATTRLAERSSAPLQGFVNLGLAGSSHYNIGQLICGCEIKHQGYPRQIYYPGSWIWSRMTKAPQLARLLTVAQATDDYPPDGVVDMEAAGYFQAAQGYCDREWVQCLKVVSDTPQRPKEQVHANAAAILLEHHREQIIDFVTTMAHELAKHSQSLPSRRQELPTGGWHLSFYQRQQYQELARRFQIWDANDALKQLLAKARSAAELIASMQLYLQQKDYSWTP